MEKVFTASILVGAKLSSSIHKTFNTINKELTELNTGVKDAKKQLDFSNQLVAQQKKVKILTFVNKSNILSTDKTTLALKREKSALKKLSNEAINYGLNAGKAREENKRLALSFKQLQATRLKKSFKDAQFKLAGYGAGLLGMKYTIGNLINKATEEERASLFLRTVINAKDGNKDRAIGESLKSAHANERNSLASTNELLGIEYNLNSAGLDEKLSRASTLLIHKVAKVTAGEGEQVAAIMGITFNNMADSIEGTAEEKMSTIGNVLAKTQFKYQIKDFNQLGEGMKEAAASASAAKLPFMQTAALIGQLNNAGVQGSSAGTALNATLRSLSKASEELGFEIVRSADGSLDLISTLQGLDEATSFMQTDEKSDLLQKLFGDEGKKGVIPLLNNIKNLKTGIKELENAGKSGLVEKEYKTFNNSQGAQLIKFTNNLSQLGSIIGSGILPPLNAVLTVITKTIGWIGQLADKSSLVGGIISTVVVGLSSMVVVMTALTVKQVLFNAVAMLNPLSPMMLGLVAVFTLVYTQWDRVKAVFSSVANKALWLVKYLTPVGWMFQLAGSALKGLHSIWGKVEGTFGKIASWFGFGDSKATNKNTDNKKLGEAISNTDTMPKLNIADKTAYLNTAKNSNTTNTNNITINQQPGEDAQSLAQRVMEKINYNQGLEQRNAMYDY